MHTTQKYKLSPWGFYLTHLLMLAVPFQYYYSPLATYLTVIIAFILVPLLDVVFGEDHNNFTPQEMERLENSFLYRWAPITLVPLQLGLIIWSCVMISREGYSFLSAPFWGMALAVGIVNTAAGGAGGHELIHRVSKLEKFCGAFLYSMVCYGHFALEHIVGHHVRVSTKEDPTSSRKGESLYAFLPRTIVGSFMSVWEFEKERLGKSKKSVWSINNRLWRYLVFPVLFVPAVQVFLGTQATLYFFAQSVVCIILIEMVNYIEHYGLQRKETAPGKYEKVTPLHSWNAAYLVSNYFLFGLPRHSDHHAHANRKYQLLRSFTEAPQMPAGYPAMYILALFPPLWRMVMDPRVEKFQKQMEETRSGRLTSLAI